MSILTNYFEVSYSLIYALTEPVTFFHDRICFLFCVQGSIFLAEGTRTTRLEKGDLILIKETGNSLLQPEDRAMFLYVPFDNMFFRDQFGRDYSRLRCNSAADPGRNYDPVRSSLIRLAVAHVQNPEENQFLINSEIFTLFQALRAGFLDEADPEKDVKLRKNDASLRVQELEEYISDNYYRPITLQDAASYMNYTPQHMANFMRKHFRLTFNHYLARFRLNMSTSYLKYRDYPVSMISSLCGFPSTAVYLKEFQKQYLTTPDYYRKNYLDMHPEPFEGLAAFTDTAIIRDYLETGFSILPGKTPVIETTNRQYHTFDVSSSVAISRPWMEMINLGNAENFDNPLFRQHVEMLQNTLHFRYGRVINILTLAESYTEDTNLVWQFHRVFHAIDYMRSLGLIPFLDLSNKDTNIFRENNPSFSEDPASFDRKSGSLVPEFLRQCSRRYDPEELAEWKFELWLRYHDSRMNTIETTEDYISRFRRYHDVIKYYMPDTALGGCGFNTFLPDSILIELLEGFSHSDVRPDFLSVYIFPYKKQNMVPDTFPTIPPLEETADYFPQRLASIRGYMRDAGFGDLPLYVTEFSTHISFQNHLNDSMYQAAFLIRQLMHSRTLADGFAYWIASDFSMEFQNNSLFLFGGNGLISQQGGRKPGFFAYNFLSRLGDHLIGQGVHYTITRSSDDSYQILLYNYTHFSRHFCQAPDRYELTNFTYAIFENKAPYEFYLRLKNLPKGNYKQTRFLANQEHGCLFTRWSQMQFASDFSTDELEMLKGECIPHMEISHSYIDGTLLLTQLVGRNEICLITLQRMV